MRIRYGVPFFSIVIPVYNVGPYLRESLNSLLQQVFRDWEAICVDDGSTDASGAILDEFAARDERIRVIHKANGGTSTARNAALEVACGEWIGFLDGDDLMAPDWLEAAAVVLERYPSVDWLLQNYTRFENDIPKAHEVSVDKMKCRVLEGKDVLYLGWPEVMRRGYTWRNFYRRRAIAEARYTVGIRWMQDMYFTLRALPCFKNAVWSTFDGYYYRSRGGSSCGSKVRLDDPIKNFREMNLIWTEQRALLLNASNLKCIRKNIAVSMYDVLGPWLNSYGKTNPEECQTLSSILCEAWKLGCFKPFMLPRGFKYRAMVVWFVLTGKWVKRSKAVD